jgi:uncharacterized protein DUF6176
MRYQTQCVKIRFKPDSVERVREWAITLNDSRRAEALATLPDENGHPRGGLFGSHHGKARMPGHHLGG